MQDGLLPSMEVLVSHLGLLLNMHTHRMSFWRCRLAKAATLVVVLLATNPEPFPLEMACPVP